MSIEDFLAIWLRMILIFGYIAAVLGAGYLVFGWLFAHVGLVGGIAAGVPLIALAFAGYVWVLAACEAGSG